MVEDAAHILLTGLKEFSLFSDSSGDWATCSGISGRKRRREVAQDQADFRSGIETTDERQQAEATRLSRLSEAECTW